MLVLKFGGTSVGSANSLKNILEIVKDLLQKDKKIVMVVSAFSGVTNQLQALSDLAQKRDSRYQEVLEEIRSRHKEMIAGLMGEKAPATEELIMPLLLELAEIIHGTFLLRECSPRSKDLILSFGERLSAIIINSYFNTMGVGSLFVDSRNIIKTDDQFGSARINYDQTNANIKERFKNPDRVFVVTGFISSTAKNVTTTLGRGGSDYTSAVLAGALDADEVQIWTDVDGVLTANPGLVPSAFPLEKLTYEEAMELSHFGAKVLHPPTIQPCSEKGITIRILNTFNRDFKGTVISAKVGDPDTPITGLTAIDGVSLLTIQGSGMVGVRGIAARLFDSMAQKDVNVILITQASSEHSICVAVSPDQAKTAKKAK